MTSALEAWYVVDPLVSILWLTTDIHLPNSDGPLNIDPYPKLYPRWGDP